ncbi:unnamed protein product [Prunus armeniaca]|uniref:AAA+ ATPase domain-containing protein n=1 Tax=Prunus armeniaca TaxID=36596 RepID=A0A6J5Y3K4_PRUAR|nr:unnamed protein product [Prunus armeniaca]
MKAINVSIDRYEELDDTFDGVKMKWCYVVTLEKPRNGSRISLLITSSHELQLTPSQIMKTYELDKGADTVKTVMTDFELCKLSNYPSLMNKRFSLHLKLWLIINLTSLSTCYPISSPTLWDLNYRATQMFSLNNVMPETASSMFSVYASFATFMMVFRSMANDFIPDPLRTYISSSLSYLFSPLSGLFSFYLTLAFYEYSDMSRNQVYDAAAVYLEKKIGPATQRLRVSKTPRKKSMGVAIDRDEEVIDTFDNIKLKWRLVTETKIGNNNRLRYFELSFRKKHKERVMGSYLPHVLAQATAMKQEEKVLKIYTRHILSWEDVVEDGNTEWGSINLEHPATFETMALEPDLKRTIVEDLERFVSRREFYKKVGKAWKRGYLLYGPPGTGKSSLIAAMANFLKFDVFDLELTSIRSDSHLKRVLLSTTNRSILVIEDIDCCKVTLSGLLNFIDGLWSSCGDERIIVFTTNRKEKLDPALLRPGRMDLHIHLSYCTTSGFRILASNYLGIRDDNRPRLCGEVEGLIKSTEVTPAEVAEELMKSDDADVALQGLVNFIIKKKLETERYMKKLKTKKKRRRRRWIRNLFNFRLW